MSKHSFVLFSFLSFLSISFSSEAQSLSDAADRLKAIRVRFDTMEPYIMYGAPDHPFPLCSDVLERKTAEHNAIFAAFASKQMTQLSNRIVAFAKHERQTEDRLAGKYHEEMLASARLATTDDSNPKAPIVLASIEGAKQEAAWKLEPYQKKLRNDSIAHLEKFKNMALARAFEDFFSDPLIAPLRRDFSLTWTNDKIPTAIGDTQTFVQVEPNPKALYDMQKRLGHSMKHPQEDRVQPPPYTGTGGYVCFQGDTQVIRSDGKSIRIAAYEPGDHSWALSSTASVTDDARYQKDCWANVPSVHIGEVHDWVDQSQGQNMKEEQLLNVTYEGESVHTTVRVTAGHRFLVSNDEGRTWAWVPAGDPNFKIGSWLFSDTEHKTRLRITAIDTPPQRNDFQLKTAEKLGMGVIKVYNLQVPQTSVYYVIGSDKGKSKDPYANRVLVHNTY